MDELMRAIKGIYNLSDLARRPILLEMIAETLVHSDIAEVRNPADLYGLYVDTWLQVESDKGTFRRLVSEKDRLFVSMTLAWMFYESGEDRIHWRDLQLAVRDYFDLEEAEDVDYFSGDVRTCTFLIRDGAGYFRFAHPSFQEYFCARFLLEPRREILDVFFVKEQAQEVRVWNIEDSAPAILQFAGDLLGFPIRPTLWELVSEILAEHGDEMEWDGERETSQVAGMVAELTRGATPAFEIGELAVAHKGTFRTLMTIVARTRELHPKAEWVKLLYEELLSGGRGAAEFERR